MASNPGWRLGRAKERGRLLRIHDNIFSSKAEFPLFQWNPFSSDLETKLVFCSTSLRFNTKQERVYPIGSVYTVLQTLVINLNFWLFSLKRPNHWVNSHKLQLHSFLWSCPRDPPLTLTSESQTAGLHVFCWFFFVLFFLLQLQQFVGQDTDKVKRVREKFGL